MGRGVRGNEKVNEYFLIKLENVREKFGGFGKKV